MKTQAHYSQLHLLHLLAFLAFGLLGLLPLTAWSQTPDLASRYANLAFKVLDISEQNYRNAPALSIRLASPLDAKSNFQSFFQVQDRQMKPVDGQWILSDNGVQLYFQNIEPQQTYTITINAKLTDALGRTLSADSPLKTELKTRALPPTASFSSTGMVLPANLGKGLPVDSVNVAEVDIDFHRVMADKVPQFLSRYGESKTSTNYWYLSKENVDEESGYVDNHLGSFLNLAYSGRFSLKTVKNSKIRNYLPIESVPALTQPGLYLAIMKAAGRYPDDYQTTYFFISDLGLHTRIFDRHFDIYLSSLKTGQALAQVKTLLLGENGETLAQGLTDAAGFVNFARPAKNPALIFAQLNSQIALVDLRSSALDLSEFKQGTRHGQNQELFIYGPRDIYRPGETVSFAALLRDPDAQFSKSLPLAAEIQQPDGSKISQFTWTGDAQGYYQHQWEIPKTAALGLYKLKVISPDEEAKHYAFHVEDFLPERLSLELHAAEGLPAIVGASEDLALAIKGAYLYGAPAALNKLTLKVTSVMDREPLPEQWPGFQFGNLKEEASYQSDEQSTELDKDGLLSWNMASEWGNQQSPLKLKVEASLFDDGGRPINRTYYQRAWPYDSAVGIRPVSFSASDKNAKAPANSLVEFEIIKANLSGQLLAAPALELNLIQEDRNYYWSYSSDNGWNQEFSSKEFTVYNQTLAVTAAKTSVRLPVEWGEYRLEITDPETKAITSYRFRAGESWWFDETTTTTQAAPRPDQVLIQLNQARYRAGETAKVRITAPFDGEALVTVEANQRLWLQRLKVSAQGTEVAIAINPEWKRHDIFVTAMVLKPAGEGSKPGPNRAFGLLHLPLDRTERQLAVSLEAPHKTLPNQKFHTQLKLAKPPAAGETVFVTLAAVDVGVLSLTHFKTPDAFAWFFEPRAYTPALKDLYYRVIENQEGDWAKLRFGGDASIDLTGKQPDEGIEILSKFMGPVAFDAKGEATIAFDLPDFNGKMRLMALAYSNSQYGMAEQEVTIAAPVIAELTTPRFLGGGDQSQLTLMLQNLTEQPQTMAVTLEVTHPLQMKNSGEPQTITLKPQQKQVVVYPVTAAMGFDQASIDLTVQGVMLAGETAPLSFTRHWALPVRPAVAAETRKQYQTLTKGQTFTADSKKLLNGLETSSVHSRLTLSTEPPLNLTQHLHDLLHYPYGCLEQTTSSAYPLAVATPERMKALGLGNEDLSQEERGKRIRVAVERLSGMQKSNGSFGLWGNQDPEEHWLTVYASDFLLQIRDGGFSVSDNLLNRALARLEEYLLAEGILVEERWSNDAEHYNFAYKAYAGFVLSRLNRANLGSLRNLYDHHALEAKTALPLVHLALALANQGDALRSQAALKKALELKRNDWKNYYYYGDYGTAIRDESLLLGLLSSANKLPATATQRLFELAGEINSRSYFSTQERTALFILGSSLKTDANKTWQGELNQQPLTGKQWSRLFNSGDTLKAMNFKLTSEGPIYVRYEVNGYPTTPPAASEPKDRLYLTRTYYDRQGQKLTGNTFKAGDLVLVDVTLWNHWERMPDLLLVDLLPAGFELENQNLDNSIKIDDRVIDGKTIAQHLQDQPLKHQEFRADRFVAALELELGNKTSKHLFYLMRAVTPGHYQVPQPTVEDMYRPSIRAIGSNKLAWVDIVGKDTVAKTPPSPTATATPQVLLQQMLSGASDNNEALLLQAKQQLEARPKVARGNRKTARKLNDDGLAAFNQQNYPVALARFEEAIKADPADVEIHNNLGLALLKAGKLTEAETALFNTLSLQPNRSGAWINLAELYAQQQKVPATLGALRNTYRFSGNPDKTRDYLLTLSSKADATTILKEAAVKVLDEINAQP